LLIVAVAAVASAQLRVCADPDNLPFSNRAHQGFENRIASLLAHEMHTSLEYTWQRMGRGFVREVLDKHQCDVLLGIPQNFPGVITTDPYYRSTYVFVSLRDRHLPLTSFDDPDLKHLKIGVQVLSEEYAPPAQALGRRGLVSNLVGFETTGGSTHDIIDAVARKRVDAAIVWGPSAGYFAKKYPTELQLTPTPSFDSPGVMLAFSISMAVRKADTELRDRLDRLLAAHQAAVDRILRSYGVPLLPTPHREVAGE
jgi:quinoprotein dehydrogenase-associated probable ABC transporter substrate-binding protein